MEKINNARKKKEHVPVNSWMTETLIRVTKSTQAKLKVQASLKGISIKEHVEALANSMGGDKLCKACGEAIEKSRQKVDIKNPK